MAAKVLLPRWFPPDYKVDPKISDLFAAQDHPVSATGKKAWDEDAHERVPAGQPGGGEFGSGGSGSSDYKSSWRPQMTPAEGHAWAEAAGSKYTKTVVHITSAENLDGIVGTGFHTRESEGAVGSINAAGAYFATDSNTAAFYEGLVRGEPRESVDGVPVPVKGDTAISAVVVLQNPLEMEYKGSWIVFGPNFTQLPDDQTIRGGTGDEFRMRSLRAAGVDLPMEPYNQVWGDDSLHESQKFTQASLDMIQSPQKTTDAIRAAGYDGMIIRTNNAMDTQRGAYLSGNQVIIFDKEQTVVIGTAQGSDPAILRSAFRKTLDLWKLRFKQRFMPDAKAWDESAHPRVPAGESGGGQFGDGRGTLKTDDVVAAAKALGEGRKVELSQPRQVATLLNELHRVALEAQAKGEDAPKYDLCNVSVEGTNLFCAESLGVPRVNMPQLSGIPIPGTPADALDKDYKGGVNLGPAFQDYLANKGYSMETTTEDPAYLRASQSQLNGVSVAAIMNRTGIDLSDRPIFISNDNYVIDGHHRWAADIGLRYSDSPDLRIPVTRIDAGIVTLLHAATEFTSKMGMPSRTIKRWDGKEWVEEDHPRQPNGEFGEGGGALGKAVPSSEDTRSDEGDHGNIALAKLMTTNPAVQTAESVKNKVVTDLSQRSGLSYERTNALVATWAGSSSDSQPDSIAMQMAVAQQFGVTPTDYIRQAAATAATDESPSPNGLSKQQLADQSLYQAQPWDERQADASKFVAAMYSATQETLKEQGVTTVTAFRGVGFVDPNAGAYAPVDTATEQARAAYDAAAGDENGAELDQNPISSWSVESAAAFSFATSQNDAADGYILSADIPAERILSIATTGIGCLSEAELTVVGGSADEFGMVHVEHVQDDSMAEEDDEADDDEDYDL